MSRDANALKDPVFFYGVGLASHCELDAVAGGLGSYFTRHRHCCCKNLAENPVLRHLTIAYVSQLALPDLFETSRFHTGKGSCESLNFQVLEGALR